MATLTVGTGFFSTIQAAIDAAQAGDTVEIASGFSTSETTLTLRSSVSVIGEAGPAVYLDGGVLQVDMSKLPAPVAAVDLSGLDVNAKLLSLGSLTQIETSAAHGLELDGEQIAVISNANATLTVAGGGAVNIVNADLTLPSGGTPASVANLLGLEFAGLDSQKSLIPDNFTVEGSHTDAFAALWIPLDQLYVGSGDYYNLAINSSFVHLGNDYASYLEEGGEPLVDIIKVPAGRAQSLHDNILGNLGDGPIASRFTSLGQPDPRTDDGADFGSRPFHNGSVDGSGLYSNPAAVSAVMAWDMSHGVSYPASLPAPYAVLDGVNTFTGTSADNYFFGGSGNDTIDGGAGIDTAAYTATINTSGITDDGAGHFVVATGGSEGTDTLSGVEKIDGAGTHNILLVGNGGYATIQAAVDAAAAGDTIIVGPGTFAGATIGKELTIIGQGAGQTTITSPGSTGFLLTGNIDGTAGDAHATVTIQGFTFSGNTVGVGVANSATLLDHLVVENSDFVGNTIHGVGTGSGAFGVGAVDISDSTFEHNGNGSLNGDGDIVLFGFTGDALIKNVTIDGGANATPTNANADTAIQINGRDPVSYDVTQPIGNVVFDNVHVTGSYAKVLVYVQGYTDLDGLDFQGNGNSFTGHAGWGWALAIDPTADETSAATPGTPGEPGFFDDTAAATLAPNTVDLSHVTVSNDIPVNVTAGHPLFAYNGTALGTVYSGTPVADHVTGTDGIDVIVGRGGDDIIHAGGDTDAINAGSGNDTIDGGAGIDVAFYATTVAAGSVTAVVDGDPSTAGNQAGWQVAAGADGTDLLTSVEKVTDSGGHSVLLVGNGGYATIQAAIDAAATGDTVLVADGTYNETVTLKSGITLLGAGANEGAVVINGSMALPASLSNVEVGNLTVHNGSTTSYLLDMRSTTDLTDVVFHDVTFALVSDFLPTNSGGSHSNDAPIGISYARGSIALHDGADGGSAGLTFRDVTMASNDHAMGVANELAMLQIESAGGAKLVFDNLDLSGMNPGTATLGAQFNVSGNGTADAIEIVDSSTSGGGNFYVSGFESAVVTGNVFDGQGLALNGAKHATVTGNTFQNIDDSITANGTQHRGLVIEDAWGTDGVSHITVTGNTFNNITAVDGGIAFQRFTDGSPANTATIDRLSDVDIHGNSFTGLGAGVNPVYLDPDYFGAGAVLPTAFHDAQFIIGTSGADTIVDVSTGNMAIFAGAGNDSVTGGAGDDTISGGTGADAMSGGTGNDTYIVDNVADVATEALNAGVDTVQSSVSYTLGANVENLTLTDGASNTQTFDDMALGAIADGENGWKVAGPARDQAVVNVAGSNNAFHISSDIVSGDFGGPYSPALSAAAGESAVSAYQSQSIAFDVKAVSSLVDGSRLEIDFANAAGTDRNNFLVIESTGSGLRIAVNEPTTAGGWAVNNFSAFSGNRTLVSGIDQSVSHHLEMRLTYVDGQNNDRIDIYLDGAMIGSTTTFENYRDFSPDLAPNPNHATNIAANLTDRVLFRTGDAGQPHDGPGGQNQGFNIDNVTTAVYNNTSATGNDDANVITGNSGDNVISGLGGADTLHGGAGNDTLIGGLGNDIITGDAGNDVIKYVVGDGADAIDGGTGIDTLDYTGTTSAVTVNLATGSATGIGSMTSIENVTGGSGDDSLTGDAGVNVLTGGAGNDTLSGGAGADTMVGGTGDDTYTVDNTGDVVTEALNEGTDTVQSSASYTLGANVENLRLTGTANVDGTGNALDNDITGNGGNNTLDGGAGADTMRGGAGNDAYIVDNAGDTVIETSAANGTDTVLSSVTFNLGANVENLTLTGNANVNGGGNGDANVLTGNTGANVLTGGGGNDALVGGGGTDTAVYSAAITTASVTSDGAGHFVVAAGGSEGTDTLSGIEKIDGAGTANILLVGNGGYATIQAAIAAAATGDTIMIAAGNYNENVVIDKGVTLVGLGNVTIHGTFESDNGVTGNLSDWIATAPSYNGASGNGVTIAANNVALSNINIDGFLYGVRFASDVSNTALTNVDVSNSVIGIEKSTDADINGLTVTGGSFTYGYIGIDFAKDTAVGQAGNGLATNVTISGTHFEDMTAKGIYVEALSNALITGVSMDHVGFYGAGAASGGPALVAGVGIEVNLKNGVYHDITITDFTLTDTGVSNGAGTSHNNAAAISVKTRDDAPSNNGTPATWTGGDLVISNGTIDGTSTGIRAGETNKTVAGPPVAVTGVTVTDAIQDAQNGDVENVSQSVLTVEGTSGADSYIASPQSTGSIVFHGGGGVDTLTGGGGNDTFKYVVGDGADVIDGGAGTDTLDYTGSAGAVTVDLGAGTATGFGVGGITSIENVVGGSAGDTLIGDAGDNTLTGGGGDDTLVGGGGNDTAVYTTTLLFTDVVFTAGEGWSVNGGVAGGNDNLEDIAFVEHNGGRYVLIDKPAGTFGFASEDDAVAAGAGTRPGDTFVYAEVPPSIEITLDTDEDLEFTIPYDNVPTEVHITGTGSAHVTTGSGDDFIVTGDGADVIHTGDGNDIVQTGDGDDEIVGGQGGGDDIYDGQGGSNTVSYPSATNSITIDLRLADRSEQPANGGGTIGDLLESAEPPYDRDLLVGFAQGVDIGTDVLIDIQNANGGQGADTIFGNDNANIISGAGGSDDLSGGAGNDTFNYTVGDGVDIIDGGDDTDTLAVSGTTGDDTIDVTVDGLGAITVIEGMTPTTVESYTVDGLANGVAGDTLSYAGSSSGVTVNLSLGSATGGFTSIAGIENVIGGSFDDTLTGDSGDNRLDGGANGVLGDTMAGGLGNDTYVVDSSLDTVTENANEGTDTVLSSLADYTLTANVDNLTLTGSANINGTGNGDANVITGNSGNNTLDGGAGADTMTGGAGNDTYIVDDAGDTVTEALNEGTDLVQSSLSFTLGANVDNLTLTGSAVSGTGNGDANVITGNGGDNILTGGGGADTLIGDLGTDTAQYTAAITSAMVASDGAGHFIVTTGGAEGTDTLSGIEKIDGAGTANILLVGNGGYATIQAAIDAAVAGDTIMLAAGTYDEDIVLDRAVTILGANHGVAGTGTRGLESVITGGFEITGAGAVIDGVRITGGALAFGSLDAIHVSADNVTITNSVLQGAGVADTFALETEAGAGITGLVISNNLIAGWNDGVSLQQGTEATITGNTLQDMVGLALRLDGPAATTSVTGNFFLNNPGTGHIGVGVFDGDLDVGSIIGANTLDASGGRIGIFANDDAPQEITGTQFGDFMFDNSVGGQAQVFHGGGGNDVIMSGDGADTLDGGTGADAMTGGAGNDTYIVDDAGDTVTEALNEGTDLVQSSLSFTLGANVENLTLTGVLAIDGVGNSDGNVITGNSAANTLTGLAGNDVLDGGLGDDTMTGGAGNDSYVVDDAGDTVTELSGEGTDTVHVSISYTLGANVENLTLTGAAFIGTGNDVANVMTGNASSNVLVGFGGNDTLDGGAGGDMLVGGLGNDTYVVDNAGDFVVESANEGIDTVNASTHYRLAENVENLTLTGSADLQAYGNSDANTLTGNAGNNLLDGDAGADTMLGGAGNDVYFVDNIGDQVIENANEGTDAVFSTAHFQLSANVETLVLQGSADLQGYGNSDANKIFGNTGNNLLNGAGGADTMRGGAGNDVYFVDNIGDQVIENLNEGTDAVFATVDYTLTANVETLVLQGAGNLSGTGNALDNKLFGNTGDNILNGGAGADRLTGGLGNDTYVVDNIGDVVTEAAGQGTDTVMASTHYLLAENVENLTLTGSADLQAYGNSDANTLTGNAGNNILGGGAGADAMFGGAGNDVYYVDNIGDQVIENLNEGTDAVFATVGFTLSANVETLVLQGAGNLSGTGNALDNKLFGNSGDNTLNGGAGADRLTGGVGNDTFVFNAGQANGDTIVDFAGNGASAGDTLNFVGFGTAAQGATFTQIGATNQWTIHSGLDAHDEIITLANGAPVHPTDFLFG